MSQSLVEADTDYSLVANTTDKAVSPERRVGSAPNLVSTYFRWWRS